MNKFQPVNSLPSIEAEILKFWRDNNIFSQVVCEHKNGTPFIFYDGPPFANGHPHYGHITQMAVKDAVLRYKTMLGFNVPRKIGWDTHGLPVEYQLEKELGLSGKKSIEDYGVDRFVEAARASVLQYSGEWVSTMERMGRWMDLKHPYTTMDNSYIESVWWAFSELYSKGLIYEDYRVGPYCPRCGTVLSNFEVNQGYKDDVADPSVVVKFEVTHANESMSKYVGAHLLVWTTTPWTLPVNLAVAVDPQAEYALVESGGSNYVIANSLIERVFADSEHKKILDRVLGSEIVGLQYKPLYSLGDQSLDYKVVAGHHVSLEDGTGLVHMAPAHGEDDFKIGKAEGLPVISSVEPDGKLKTGFGWPGEGLFYKQADKEILAELDARGLLFKHETFKHTYPFCWRCDTPLLYYPTTSWYVAVTKIKDQLVSENQKIEWQPEHIRDGRFGKWLEGARDWAISRDRFWGAPIPVWKCANGHMKVIGSADEVQLQDLHRPYIDDVTFTCEDCNQIMHREPFVFDCWFESGSMPFAQFGYPHKNKELFDAQNNLNYPADFIVEALDQTRGWFYTLHVLGVALFGKAAYSAVDVNGLILAGDGKKLSKKLRNYTEPEILFENEGVDAFRLFVLTATAIGEDYRFSDDAVRDVRRRWITPLLNVVSYFELSKQVIDTSETPDYYTKLDDWMKARVAQARAEVFAAMDGSDRHAPYDLVRACRTFGPLVEDLSTWYVRLCRGRTDAMFTDTLKQVLIEISCTSASFLPFVTEYVYQQLVSENSDFPRSVHLCKLAPLAQWENPELLSEMDFVRSAVTLGREQRALHKINNRQPIGGITLHGLLSLGEWQSELLKHELNAKNIQSNTVTDRQTHDFRVEIDTVITDELKAEGDANELRRTIQDLRRQAGVTPGQVVQVSISNLPEDVALALTRQLKNTRICDGVRSDSTVETTFKSWHIILGI